MKLTPFIYFIFLLFVATQPISGMNNTTLEIGEYAPAFRLQGANGKFYSLHDFNSSKTLVILFTCDKCPVSKVYTERFFALSNEFKNKDVAFVAIAASWDEFHVPANSANLVRLLDYKHSPVTASFAPAVLPFVFVFDQNRKLCYKGSIDDSEDPGNIRNHYLKESLYKLDKNELPIVSESVVIGCELKKQTDIIPPNSHHPATTTHARGGLHLNKIDLYQLKLLVSDHNSTRHKLIFFWSTKCHLCTFELADFPHTAKFLKNMDVDVVTINLDGIEKYQKVKKTLSADHCTGTHLIYEESKNAGETIHSSFKEKWGEHIPHIVLVAPGGEIVFSDIDLTSQQDLRHKVSAIVQNKHKTQHPNPVSSAH